MYTITFNKVKITNIWVSLTKFIAKIKIIKLYEEIIRPVKLLQNNLFLFFLFKIIKIVDESEQIRF